VAALKEVADDVVCPAAPADFGAVSRHYDRFPQVSHRDVIAALAGYRGDVRPPGTVEECR
jgi:predicted phosphoribosyltransferase